MSGHLSRKDFELLLRRLAQRSPNNLRVGSTPPFPSLEDFDELKKLGNCNVRFSTVYRLPKFLMDAGVSGGKIYLLEAVGEKQRLARLNNVVNKLPLLVKKSELGRRSDAENFMDIVIGSRLNILVAAKIAPGFMRTVDWFICHDIFEGKAKAHLYTIVERQDISFTKYLLGGMANMDLNRSLLAQLLYTLESAQDSLGYVHYDLHTNNVFVRVARNNRQLTADFWSFVRSNGETMWISADDTNRHEPVIIDFGRNRIESPLFTKAGHQSPGWTEVLALDGYDSIGITKNMHRQYDMRRFSTHLIEMLLDEHAKPRKARTKAMRRKGGRKVDPGPDKDYLQRLFHQSRRKKNKEFMDVLDEMSGHRHVKLRSELKDNKELLDSWDRYFGELVRAADYDDVTTEEVDYVLGRFRTHGIRKLYTWVQRDEVFKLYIISYMWSWTWFTFDSSPSVVLAMPFFKKLHVKPRAAGLVIEKVARFRPIVDVTEGVLIECATGCGNTAMHLCGCKLIGYCSDSCADADWTEHQHHCTSTD